MHPAFEADLILPPMLKPKRSMGRNEPCWCGSQKKWKNCHRDRHFQKKEPIGKLQHEMHKGWCKKECLHPEASSATCGSNDNKAHTVQEAGVRLVIAENGHVLSIKKGIKNKVKNEGKLIPGKLGISMASTFKGFCSTHDNKLFEPIEQKPYVLNEKTVFLLSFRAIAYEFYQKRRALENLEIHGLADKGENFETQKIIQNRTHAHKCGLLLGMKDLVQWKLEYDSMFIAQDFMSMRYYAVEFDAVLPFVCCGVFIPEVGFDGKQLQMITCVDKELEHVCVNISAMKNKTFVAFGWNGKKNGPSQQFVESFAAIPSKEKANALLHLAVEQLENTYFKPSWWNNLGDSKQLILVRRMQNGLKPNSVLPLNTYLSLSHILSSLSVSNELGLI